MGNSDDDLIQLPKHIVQLKSKLSEEEVSDIVITCSACDERLDIKKAHSFKEHKHLSVLVCKKCFDFYGDGDFSSDENGDHYCRWCADGGRLIACDNCSNAFCVKCIRRNMGPRALATITGTDNWSCYACNPTLLKPHIRFCRRIMKHVKRKKKKVEIKNVAVSLRPSDTDSDDSSEAWRTSTWAGTLLEQTGKAIVFLNKRLARVKRKLNYNSSKANICALKLKNLLTKHKQFVEYLLVDIKNALEENPAENDLDKSGIPNKTSSPSAVIPGTSNIARETKDILGEEVEVVHPASHKDAESVGSVSQETNEGNRDRSSRNLHLSEDEDPVSRQSSKKKGKKSVPEKKDDTLEESVFPYVNEGLGEDYILPDSVSLEESSQGSEKRTKVVSPEEKIKKEVSDQLGTEEYSQVPLDNTESVIPDPVCRATENRRAKKDASKNSSSSEAEDELILVNLDEESKHELANEESGDNVSRRVTSSSPRDAHIELSRSENESNAGFALDFSSSDSDDKVTENVKEAIIKCIDKAINSEDEKEPKDDATHTENCEQTNKAKRTLRSKDKPSGSNKVTSSSDVENEKARKSLLRTLNMSTPVKKRKRIPASSSSNPSHSEGDSENISSKNTSVCKIICPEIAKDAKLKPNSAVVPVERLLIPNVAIEKTGAAKDKKPQSKKFKKDRLLEKPLDDIVSGLSTIPKQKSKTLPKSAAPVSGENH